MRVYLAKAASYNGYLIKVGPFVLLDYLVCISGPLGRGRDHVRSWTNRCSPPEVPWQWGSEVVVVVVVSEERKG